MQYKGALIPPMALSTFRTPSILSMDLIALPQQDVNTMLGKLNGATEAELIQGDAIFFTNDFIHRGLVNSIMDFCFMCVSL